MEIVSVEDPPKIHLMGGGGFNKRPKVTNVIEWNVGVRTCVRVRVCVKIFQGLAHDASLRFAI